MQAGNWQHVGGRTDGRLFDQLPSGKRRSSIDKLRSRVGQTSYSVKCPDMSIAATDFFLVPLLTPHGHLRLVPDSDAPQLPAALAQRLSDAFARGPPGRGGVIFPAAM